MNPELFRGKYRTQSTRLPCWDYSGTGHYFVTICTKDRVNYFGEIRNGIMGLNTMGDTAAKCWMEIPNHFPWVTLDEWVIMPNHVHGIVVINNPVVGVPNIPIVETQDFASLPPQRSANRFGPQSRNLGSIMRGFKIGVTKYARNNKIDFAWQPRFYDHVVRNDYDLNRIRDYIRNNPMKWDRDRNNPVEATDGLPRS